MAITEDQRHDLYEGLIEVLGREKATTLMEHLPPVGWADVATKRDLDHQSALLRHELRAESGELRRRMDERFDRTGRQVEGLRSELERGRAEDRLAWGDAVAALRVEVAGAETRVERALREQTRLYLLGMIAANATLAGLAFTFARAFGA